jgi:hypothetical protein
MRELEGSTSCPEAFEVLAEVRIPEDYPRGFDCLAEKVEQEVHTMLKAKRINPKREFFDVSLEQALEAIDLAMLNTGARSKMQKDLDREAAELRALEAEVQSREKEKQKQLEAIEAVKQQAVEQTESIHKLIKQMFLLLLVLFYVLFGCWVLVEYPAPIFFLTVFPCSVLVFILFKGRLFK